MDLQRLDPAGPRQADLAGAVAVYEAARRVDSPHDLPPTVTDWAVTLRTGWDGEPPAAYLHRDACGRVDAVLEVHLPQRDNTHLAMLEVTVRPDTRRQGLGRALYQHGTELARAAGRTTVALESWDHDHGRAFAAALGLEQAIRSVNRRQVVPELDRDRVAAVLADALEHAADYELVRVPTPVPDDVVGDMVVLAEAMNDAPVDELAYEDEVFTPDRIRAFERSQLDRGRRLYRLVARHRRTGEPAGHTVVSVRTEQPWHADQEDTGVVRAHRGHRLGLALKGSMLRWLAEEEPQLVEIDTWNAASNDHMIAVNEALGYQVLATATAYQGQL